MVSWRLLRRWKSRFAARLTLVRSSLPTLPLSPPPLVLFGSSFVSFRLAEELEMELELELGLELEELMVDSEGCD